MHLKFLFTIFGVNQEKAAIIWRSKTYNYAWLSQEIQVWQKRLADEGILVGQTVAIRADFSPQAIALFLALTENSNIIVPLLNTMKDDLCNNALQISKANFAYIIDGNDHVTLEQLRPDRGENDTDYPLYGTIRERKHPGLVLFSSGSSGTPKAAVHDFSSLLEKFKSARESMRILNFLLFDHWGGLNTMLHTLSSGGTVLTVAERSPEGICAAIEAFKIEVLPASPTFLNLLLISKAYERHDLSSLKVISYGTEPMPPATLKRALEIFPNIKLHQTYGLIELGVMRSKSKSSDSLWVKIGGDGYQTRVVDGLLQIKAKSAMLGYLNASSPFTDDGWFMTGDSVEVDGEYFKILGRKSELINVGGEKVYPQEVESIIQEVNNVAEVTVYGEKNPIMGNIVCAQVTLASKEDEKAIIQRIKRHCREKLHAFKVPIKIQILHEKQYSERFKKIRTRGTMGS